LLAVKTGDLLRLWSPAPHLSSFRTSLSWLVSGLRALVPGSRL
jgi:hypothetical protein